VLLDLRKDMTDEASKMVVMLKSNDKILNIDMVTKALENDTIYGDNFTFHLNPK